MSGIIRIDAKRSLERLQALVDVWRRVSSGPQAMLSQIFVCVGKIIPGEIVVGFQLQAFPVVLDGCIHVGLGIEAVRFFVQRKVIVSHTEIAVDECELGIYGNALFKSIDRFLIVLSRIAIVILLIVSLDGIAYCPGCCTR